MRISPKFLSKRVDNMNRWATLLLSVGLTFSGSGQAGDPSAVDLLISPGSPLDFGKQPVGSQSDTRTVTLSISQGGSALPPVMIWGIDSSKSNFKILNNKCKELGGIDGPGSCTFDATFKPSQVGELLADLGIDCQAVVSVGVTMVTCTQARGTRTVADYFRGIGTAITSVPTLSQWGVTLAALALVGAAAFRLRRS